jgi:hypothetical protein
MEFKCNHYHLKFVLYLEQILFLTHTQDAQKLNFQKKLQKT